jgi:hypothetical protein
MYSHDGKRLINMVLAGREPTIGSHLILGLNTVYDASLDGSTAPTTHNRYHTPYIVDEIEVVNSSVITDDSGGRDHIIFSGQADNNKRYMANNIGLVAIRSGGSTRSHKNVANVANGTNWTGYTAVVSPPSVFTNDGILSISQGSAYYTNNISLDGYGATDIIAFPLSFHGGIPTGANVQLTINYLKDGVEQNASSTAILQNTNGFYHFDFETSTRNDVNSLGTDDLPVPFVWQQRLSEFVNPLNGTPEYSLLNNLRTIKAIIVTISNAAGITMRFGTIKIVPDFESDQSRVTTSFRKLNTVLRKTDVEAYVNPEFTILGVVI